MSASARPQVKVTPQVAIAPVDLVRVVATIPPQSTYRAFCVQAYLDGMVVRRSCADLEGDDAATTHRVEWRDFREGGEYTIALDVYESNNVPSAHAETPLRIRGINDDGGER